MPLSPIISVVSSVLLFRSVASSPPPVSSNASDWWFVTPVPNAVTLNEGTPAGNNWTLSSGTLSFHFALNSSDVLLSTVTRSHCPDADCDGGGAYFSFPGTYSASCNQVNCSAGRPKPEPHDAMATVQLDHATFYLGHPREPVPSGQRFKYEGRSFAPITTKRFHWVPGRKGGEDTQWPPKGGALTLHFSLPCARLPTPRSGMLAATLTYELYAGTPFFVKRMNVTNGCDAAVFISDKLFEQPSTSRLQGYSQYITFAHAPAYAFASGSVFEAPYTLGDFSSPMNDALHAIQKWHWQRWFEPQKFEALATFAVWDVDQTAILNKGIIDRPWWPDVPTKVKSLIDEAADCGFEALLYQTDHMGGATLNGQPIPMYLEYGSVDPDMIARTKNLSDYAHSRGLEFWLYKGDQSSHFNWTEGWMEIQDASEPPPHGWPNSNGFCPSSQWGERWLQYTHSFLEQTHVDGSSCDYCWIIATMESRPEKSVGCQAHNHSHAAGAGQWENLRWWIDLTLRNFELPTAWQPETGSGRYTYGMGGGFPGNTFEMGGCDAACQWQQETAEQAEIKTVQCRECFMRNAVQGGVNGGGSEIKTAWIFGGHLWNSGIPGYVKPYTPDGADVNYEQLCFMVSTFVGTGMQGHLTGYKLTSSPTSTKMLRGWMAFRKKYNRLLNAPAMPVRAPACAFPKGVCHGWNVSDPCWQRCDISKLGFDGLFHYLPVAYFPNEKAKGLLTLWNQGHNTIAIPRLQLNVALMGDLQSLVAVDGSTVTSLPVEPVSQFVANVTLTGLRLPPRSVRNVFFYLPQADVASHAADGTISCAKPSAIKPHYAGYDVRLTTDSTTKMRIKVDDHDVSIFDAVWNSDLSLHCQSINQNLRLEGNGVRANAEQAWFGGVMNTLYGAGNSMPSAAGANSSLLNGGIPQLADRSLIKGATKTLLSSALPSGFAGFAVFDIEYPSLYPLWSYDFGPLDRRVRDLAANWTSSHHPHLAGEALVNQTIADFNAGMKELWQLQLDTATDLYPRGKFGYYRMPHCWYSNLQPFSPCNGQPEFGDQLAWLWQSEGGTFPGAYFDSASNSANNSARMISVVREAVRVAQVHGHGRPAVVPFVSYAYRGGPLDHRLLAEDMMWKMFSIPASLGVDGVVIWGGSGDAKTVDCETLSARFDSIGPKLKKLRAELTQCAVGTCNGHGRCASWFKPTRCVCYADWAGDKCEHRRTNLKTDDTSTTTTSTTTTSTTTVFAPREMCVQLPLADRSGRGCTAAENLRRCFQIAEVGLLVVAAFDDFRLLGALDLSFNHPRINIKTDDVALSKRRRVSLDFGWRFHLGDPQGATNQSVAAPDYDDSLWRETNTPHDFVIEGNFTKGEGPVKREGHGDLAHGYLPSGVGWYRRNFAWPSAEQRGWVTFDAIFRRSDIYVNGVHLTHHRSGYTGVEVDLGGVARAGKNVLAVRCDASVGEGWFYEGGGIYRHVWLTTVSPLHVVPHGVYAASTVAGNISKRNDNGDLTSDAGAIVRVQTTIRNLMGTSVNATLSNSAVNPQGGREAAISTVSTLISVPAGANLTVHQSVLISDPWLWSLDAPSLYTLVTEVLTTHSVDRLNTSFGIRKLGFDADRGFFLNDQHVVVRGLCNHQDFGGVGVAVPDRIQVHRVAALKEMGGNAWRCAHNPPNSELLDATDAAGMLVWDENRVYGPHDSYDRSQPTPGHQPGYENHSLIGVMDDVKAMILRDRNHPSVIWWSLCNEQGCMVSPDSDQEFAASFAARVKDEIKSLDSSRPVTAAISSDFGQGTSIALDVQGINYNYGILDNFHSAHPLVPIVSSETAACTCARGQYVTNATAGHMSQYHCVEERCLGGTTLEQGVAELEQRSFVMGGFYWSGFDYLGEPAPYAWPERNSNWGIHDLAGFRKDMFYYYQAVWTSEPVLHIFPHWNWDTSRNVSVWAFSNADSVQLSLNGVPISQQPLHGHPVPPFGHVNWSVPFSPGTLTAVGFKDGQVFCNASVSTAHRAHHLELTLVTPKDGVVSADGQDSALVSARVVDVHGILVPSASNRISFGSNSRHDLQVVGVASGDPANHDPTRAADIAAFHGMAAAILQAGGGPSGPTPSGAPVTITAAAAGLQSATVTMRLKSDDGTDTVDPDSYIGDCNTRADCGYLGECTHGACVCIKCK